MSDIIVQFISVTNCSASFSKQNWKGTPGHGRRKKTQDIFGKTMKNKNQGQGYFVGGK